MVYPVLSQPANSTMNSGVFASVDALWEKYWSSSPYHFTNNNPLIIVDRNGREIKFVGTEEQKAEFSSLVEELKLTEKGVTILKSRQDFF